jgi:hypothetical protein
MEDNKKNEQSDSNEENNKVDDTPGVLRNRTDKKINQDTAGYNSNADTHWRTSVNPHSTYYKYRGTSGYDRNPNISPGQTHQHG